MISADFAPNESSRDALISLKILITPWSWNRGKALPRVKARLRSFFPGTSISFFLTARAGLYHTLKALELKKGSQVLVQGFTCEAVILPILALNLSPQYVDIEKNTYSCVISDLEKKYSPDAKVLILQHTFGITPIEREKILAFARAKKLFVIEDLAHGFDPNLFKDHTSLFRLHNSAFLLSFGRSKFLSSVFGGAVATKNKKLTTKLLSFEKTLRAPSSLFIFKLLLYKPLALIIKKTYGIGLGKLLHLVTRSFEIPPGEVTAQERRGEFDQTLNKTYPNALARLLLTQINQFERINNNRSLICEIYKRAFGHNLPNSNLPRYPLLVNDREAILKKFRRKNIYLGTWYDQVIGPRNINFEKMNYKKGSCPVAEEVTRKIINLPTLVSEKEAAKIIKIFKIQDFRF